MLATLPRSRMWAVRRFTGPLPGKQYPLLWGSMQLLQLSGLHRDSRETILPSATARPYFSKHSTAYSNSWGGNGSERTASASGIRSIDRTAGPRSVRLLRAHYTTCSTCYFLIASEPHRGHDLPTFGRGTKRAGSPKHPQQATADTLPSGSSDQAQRRVRPSFRKTRYGYSVDTCTSSR